MSRTPPAWPRPDGGGGASAPTSRSPSGPPSRVGARPPRARVRRPSSAPPWGRSTGHRRTAASQAARATAPEARGAARSARCRCADASHPGPRARVRCSGRVTARSSAGQSSSPPRHPRWCDPALTTRSPERAASRSDPGPTGASLPDRPRSDDPQPAPWLASAPHGAPAYPLFNNPGILNPSPSPGPRMTGSDLARLETSPQLEGFRTRGVEVLLLPDPVDSFWVTAGVDYEGKPFKSVTQGAADLALIPRVAPKGESSAQVSEAVTRFIAGVKATLGEQVSDVRASERLTESAVCLVAPESGLDRQLERILARAGQLGSAAKPILELNPQHELIVALANLAEDEQAL